MPTLPSSSSPSFILPEPLISASLPTPGLPYRYFDFLPESPTLWKQPHFRLSSPITALKGLANDLFEACDIGKAEDEEIVRCISGRVDAAKLAKNLAYLKTILEEESNSTSNDESGGSSVDSGLDINMEAKEALSSGQPLRQP